MKIKEEVLQAFWNMRMMPLKKPVYTTDAEPIEILSYGTHNTDSGPDFKNAKIKIGGTLWFGHVEMHVVSDDWYSHQHHNDSAYNNVILHVVWNHQKEVYHDKKHKIPTLILKEYIPDSFLHNYKALQANTDWVPCAKLIPSLENIKIYSWLDRLLVERIQEKTVWLHSLLQRNNNNWEETLYQSIAYSLGLKLNASNMLALAQTVPYKLLLKYAGNLRKIEGALFGVAGLLEEPIEDEYIKSLIYNYQHISHKHQLKKIKEPFQFLRMRPSNFPTIRIAQLAKLVHKNKHLFSKILACTSIKEIRSIFILEPSPYWLNHYTFKTTSEHIKKPIGQGSINKVIINTIVPLLFLYGKSVGQSMYCDRAISLLQELPTENNKITRKWESIGIRPKTAADSQSLIRLKKYYCNNKKCLSCGIGTEIIKR